MATKKKDVELSLKVTTDGADAVKGLTTSLRDLAKEGGEAAPEFQRLATELDKIGQQSDTIAAFGSLKRSVADTSNEMAQAAQRVDQLGAELPDAAAKTEIFAQAQDEARGSLNSTTRLLDEARVALRELQQEYPKGSRNVDDYRIANGELQATIKTLGGEVSRLKAEYKESEAASRGAAAEERKLVAEYNQSLNAARQVSAELGRKTQALNSSREALAREGVATNDLVAAQNQLRTAFAQIKGEVDQRAEAYRRSVTTTQQLAQAEKDLVAQLEFESRAAREAAAAEAALSAKRQEAVVALRAQAAATQAAIDQAFSRTGVRSAQAIEVEIRQINESLNKLAFNARVSGAEFDRAFTAGQGKIARLRAELDGTAASTSKASGGFNILSGALNPMVAGAAAAAAAIGTLGRGAVDAVVQLESMRRSLTLVTGSTAAAERQIGLLQSVANKSGIAVGEISDSFIRFNASARTAGISGQVVNELFSNLTVAGAKLGLSSQRVGLSLDALSQIAAKGTVSMEELRQQLGDSLPGALDLSAKSLGLTQKQLISLVESGQLLAEDFLPALNTELAKLAGDGGQQVEGLAQSWNRFKNVLTDTAQTLSGGVIFGGLTTVFGAVAGVIRDLSVALVGFDQYLVTVGKSWALLFAALTGNIASFQEFKDEFSKIFEDAGQKISEYKDRVYAAGDAVVSAGEQAKVGAGGFAAANAEVVRSGGELATAEVLIAKAGAATAQAGAEAGAAIPKWVQLGAVYGEAAKSAEAQRIASEKLAEVKKIEGDVSVKLAELSGNEIAAGEARVAAAEANRVASEQLGVAREQELKVTTSQIEALRAEIELGTPLTKDKQAQIEKLVLLAEAKATAVEKSRQLAASAAQEAAAAQLSAVAYQDNSKRIAEFATEVVKAQGALEEIKKRFETDKSLKGEVEKASIALALANGKLKDAITDMDKALQLSLGTLSADYDLRVQALRLKQVEARAEEDVAKAAGNTTAARSASAKVAKIEADLSQLLAEKKNVLAQVEIEALNKKKLELSLSGQLTPEIRREIDLRIKSLEVKQAESKVDVDESKRQEASARRENAKAAADEAKAIAATADANRLAAASDSGPRGGGGGGGGGGGNGPQDGGGGGTYTQLTPSGIGTTVKEKLDALRRKEATGGLSASDLSAAQDALEVAYFNKFELTSSNRDFNAQREIDNQYAEAQGFVNRLRDVGPKLGGTNQTQTNQSSGGGSRTVNINIGGFGASVNVASQKDSDALVGVLRQVESASTRA